MSQSFRTNNQVLGGSMHKLRLVPLVSILGVLSVSFNAPARQATPPSAPATSDPRAVALLNQSLQAVVGASSVSDVTLTGTAERIVGSIDETGTATLTAMPGGYSKLNLAFPSGPRTELRNASGTPVPTTPLDGVPNPPPPSGPQPVGGWSGPDGVMHGVADHNLMTDATWFFPAFAISNVLNCQNCILSYPGKETLNGQSVLHISAIQTFSQLSPSDEPLLEHLSHTDLYLDPTTLLPLALAFDIHPDENALVDLPVQILFSDFRTFNGIEVPYHVQKLVNNALSLDIQVSGVIFDSALTATSFQLQ